MQNKENTEDQIYAFPHFVSNVYTVKKEQFLNDALAVFDERIKKTEKEKEGKSDPLFKELYPVTMTDNLFEEKTKDLCMYILNTGWTLLQEQGFKMSDKSTFFSDFWGQEHHKHSAMDEHVHPYGAQLVGFYFLDVPENSSRVVFHDPRPGKVMAHMPEENMNNATHASNMINFVPEPGMIMFSNAWLPHSFTRHGNDKPLKFIHFNICVQLAPQQCAMPEAEII
jgi:uncharacterized protein (TIGR02466 family)